MPDDKRTPASGEDRGYTPSSPVKRTLAWTGLAYMVILVAMTTYPYSTGAGLGNLGALLHRYLKIAMSHGHTGDAHIAPDDDSAGFFIHHALGPVFRRDFQIFHRGQQRHKVPLIGRRNPDSYCADIRRAGVLAAHALVQALHNLLSGGKVGNLHVQREFLL